MREFVSDQRVVDYVAMRTGAEFKGSSFTALGIVKNGAVVAGVVFNHFTGCDVSVTIAGEPSAFTKTFISRVALYVFDELKCLRISITTEQPKVIDVARRLGAKPEGIKREFFGPGRDGVMLGLLKEDWFMTRRLRPSSAKENA